MRVLGNVTRFENLSIWGNESSTELSSISRWIFVRKRMASEWVGKGMGLYACSAKALVKA
jgi:hypothetical protein